MKTHTSEARSKGARSFEKLSIEVQKTFDRKSGFQVNLKIERTIDPQISSACRFAIASACRFATSAEDMMS